MNAQATMLTEAVLGSGGLGWGGPAEDRRMRRPRGKRREIEPPLLPGLGGTSAEGKALDAKLRMLSETLAERGWVILGRILERHS